MDCFQLFTAGKEGKAVGTIETTMMSIISMHSKGVIQKEFFLAVVIKITEDLNAGVRIDKGRSDCVRYLDVVCHVTD